MLNKEEIIIILERVLSKNYVNLHLESVYIESTEIFCTFNVNNTLQKEHVENKTSEITKAINNSSLAEQIKYKIYISVTSNSSIKSGNIKAGRENILQLPKLSYQNIKYIVPIASGKGGVGKSTLTVNLAYAFKTMGLKVGILDADVYGPSINFMMSSSDTHKEKSEDHSFPTLEKDGIVYNSVSTFLKNKDDAIVLKAPMTIKLFNQLINDSNWGDLDVLLIDMPPGTGDLHINLALKFNIAGVVMICTPQKLALIDAHKAINMYKDTKVNILGIVENMNTFICPHCGKSTNIFSSNNTKDFAKSLNIEFLGDIPFSVQLREYSDSATNIIKENINNSVSASFMQIAEKVAERLKDLT